MKSTVLKTSCVWIQAASLGCQALPSSVQLWEQAIRLRIQGAVLESCNLQPEDPRRLPAVGSVVALALQAVRSVAVQVSFQNVSFWVDFGLWLLAVVAFGGNGVLEFA